MVTFRQIEARAHRADLVNSWTAAAFQPSGYDELRGGWEEWINRLEKLF